MNESFIFNRTCNFRPVARNTIKVDIEVLLKESVDNVQIHFDLYYRYNIPIDRYVDLCQYLKDKDASKAPLMRFLMENIGKYSSMNHTCPYGSVIFWKADHFNFDNFKFTPLLPSGRFRLDIEFFNNSRLNLIAFAQIYFKISDHRLWH